MAYEKILLKTNVFEQSLIRIRRLFEEFTEVVVGFSGGKDSTIVFNLAMIVARELKRLPLKVMFLDQEVEWMATIDTVRKVMYNPDVYPLWFQIPFKIDNATSYDAPALDCWSSSKEELWIREKEEISLKENIYGTIEFSEMFSKIFKVLFKDTSACYLTGMRAEESPNRLRGICNSLTYKDISWGKKLNPELGHYTFHPIYDWTYISVWKAIHDNNWNYNKVYDHYYSYGIKVQDMRVSNLNHETAIRALFILQEIEPETYIKVTKRLRGVDFAAKMSYDNYLCPKELPFMFTSWIEYRDHLLENLIHVDRKEKFKKQFQLMCNKFGESDPVIKVQINSILTNDHTFVKLKNYKLPKAEWFKYIENGGAKRDKEIREV